MHKPLAEESALPLINSALDSFFTHSKEAATKIDPSYGQLWNNLHELIQSGGKRIRPQLTLMSYTAFGGKDTAAIIPVAAAQELLHFSLLIHDDIIDRDYVRYGVPNIAGRYKLNYSQFTSSEEDLTHYAHSAAILGGDLMLSGAHQLIASSNLPGESIITAQQLLSIGIFEVAGGELLDTEFSFAPYKKGGALKVAEYKTASYSFVGPLLTGASLAGASAEQLNTLKDYAKHLGIAYQLADDLLGIFGDEQKTGKSTVSDILEGKRTYMIEKALESFSAAEQSTFMVIFGNPKATPLEVEAAKQLIESSGARRQTEEKITEYATKACSSLDTLNLPQSYHKVFQDLVTRVTKRVS